MKYLTLLFAISLLLQNNSIAQSLNDLKKYKKPELRALIIIKNSKIDSLQSVLKLSNSENSKQYSEVRELEKEISELKKSVSALNEQKEELTDYKEYSENKIYSKQTEIDALLAENGKLKKEIKQQKNNNQQAIRDAVDKFLYDTDVQPNSKKASSLKIRLKDLNSKKEQTLLAEQIRKYLAQRHQ